ncbi:MAG: hypothetical protein LUD16_07950 [Lachnospiraceae bacterium]|nr:hypothetical protein [Lachnospiraceae bacterium]
MKLFQYFMILVVFAAALLLPGYAAKWQAASLLKNEMSGTENTSEETTEVQNGQTIVIDPGHGGSKLRGIRRKAAAVPYRADNRFVYSCFKISILDYRNR